LADAIQKLIGNKELRQKMGACGRKIAVNEFSIEKVIKETLSVYDELCVQ
jgi:glycosyltransferase involved in cell wall biosynthesis